MFKFLEKLFGINVDESELLVANLDKMPPPSKKAIKRRERKASEQIEALKKRGMYLNVPFRKFEDEPPKLASVTNLKRKSA